VKVMIGFGEICSVTKCKVLLKNSSLQLNVEVQWNNIKKCVLDVSDLVGKAWRKAREL